MRQYTTVQQEILTEVRKGANPSRGTPGRRQATSLGRPQWCRSCLRGSPSQKNGDRHSPARSLPTADELFLLIPYYNSRMGSVGTVLLIVLLYFLGVPLDDFARTSTQCQGPVTSPEVKLRRAYQPSSEGHSIYNLLTQTSP